MRIAYFSDNFYPEISGISDSILTTGEALTKRGHEVAYVGPWYPKSAYKENKNISLDGVQIKRLPSVRFPNSPTGQSRVSIPIGASIPFIRRFNPHIIHTQSPYGVGLEALLASKLLAIPLIGTNHTPIEEFVQYAIIQGAWVKKFALRYDAWYYNRSRFTTAPYQGLIDNMRKSGFVGKGRAQANPVPFSSQMTKEAVREACKKELGATGHVILCSGRLAPEKQVDVVIQAFALLLKNIPDATLVITGRGSAEDSLVKLTRSLGIEDRVRFVGFVVSNKLARLYCAADVYVVMSTAETQSLSLMLAFANGIPAISARSRGLIDYTPEDCGFLVEPGDAVMVATHLKTLLGNQEMRRAMGKKAKEYIEQFDPESVALAWEEIYSDAIAKR